MKKILCGLVIAIMMTGSVFANFGYTMKNSKGKFTIAMKNGYDHNKICSGNEVFLVVQNNEGIAITQTKQTC